MSIQTLYRRLAGRPSKAELKAVAESAQVAADAAHERQRRDAEAQADALEASQASAAPSEVSETFLKACTDTRRAWHQSGLLAQSNFEKIEDCRRILRYGGPAEVAAMLCDMAGPLHAQVVAQVKGDNFSLNATRLAQTALEPLIESVAAERATPAAKKGRGAGTSEPAMLDMDALKAAVVRWIDFGTVARGRPGADQAQKIAQFMEGECTDRQCPRQLRLGVLATVAPALESALVITRLSQPYIDVMKSTHQRRPAAVRPDERKNPQWRDEHDDQVAQDVFASLVKGGLQASRAAFKANAQ